MTPGPGTGYVEGTRRATAEDLPRLDQLAGEALAELAPTRGGAVYAAREARPLPAEPSLRAALDDPRHHLVVGTLDDVVVGYAAARLEDLRNGTRLAVVDDLYVEPAARDVGVGEALMDDVLAWAVEQGCAGVDALALPGNRETKNFFERFGLTARAIIVHRTLERPEG